MSLKWHAITLWKITKTDNVRTYNVTLRRVRVTIVVVEKQYV